MENTVIPRKIGSVSSYIKAIFDLRNTKVSEYSLSSYWFFRGQKNSLWGMCPNVFRNDALKYEFDAIETAIRQRPYDFRECASDFEILTKLQHYGLGTRLLDVTLNPLVALYFASEKCEEYLQKHKRVSEYDSENLMYSVIQEVLSEKAFSSIGCAVHLSLATLVKNYEPLTEEERKYARNPLTHVDFLLFNQMDKQPVLAIEVDGTGFHEAGSKQAERDMKKNSILEKCAVPLLRLRTDGSGEKEKIKNALKRE